MNRSNSVLLALLAGGSAGIIIGFFLAPEKGSDARKNFAEKAKKMADDLLKMAEETVDKMCHPEKEEQEQKEQV